MSATAFQKDPDAKIMQKNLKNNDAFDRVSKYLPKTIRFLLVIET